MLFALSSVWSLFRQFSVYNVHTHCQELNLVTSGPFWGSFKKEAPSLPRTRPDREMELDMRMNAVGGQFQEQTILRIPYAYSRPESQVVIEQCCWIILKFYHHGPQGLWLSLLFPWGKGGFDHLCFYSSLRAKTQSKFWANSFIWFYNLKTLISESQKPRRRVGIADRKVFMSRKHSCCAQHFTSTS